MNEKHIMELPSCEKLTSQDYKLKYFLPTQGIYIYVDILKYFLPNRLTLITACIYPS